MTIPERRVLDTVRTLGELGRLRPGDLRGAADMEASRGECARTASRRAAQAAGGIRGEARGVIDAGEREVNT